MVYLYSSHRVIYDHNTPAIMTFSVHNSHLRVLHYGRLIYHLSVFSTLHRLTSAGLVGGQRQTSGPVRAEFGISSKIPQRDCPPPTRVKTVVYLFIFPSNSFRYVIGKHGGFKSARFKAER